MAQQCPLLYRQVDSTITRINTLFVIGGVIAYLVLDNAIILMLLIIDFMIRLYGYKHISPTQNVSLWIQGKFSLPVKLEDAGAKRLAACFGVAFMSALFLFHYLGPDWAVTAVAAMYLFAASLDLFLGFCIACKLYYLVKKVYPQRFE